MYIHQYLFFIKCKNFCFQNIGADMDSAQKSRFRCTEGMKQDARLGRHLCTASFLTVTNSVAAFGYFIVIILNSSVIISYVSLK